MPISFEEFFTTCTVHGLLQIQKSRMRIWWVVFVVMALIGTIIHLSVLSIKYSDSPINSEIFPYGTDFEFPDITLCPNIIYSYLQAKTGNRSLLEEVRKFKKIISLIWKASIDMGYMSSNLTEEEIERLSHYSMMPWIFEKKISVYKENVILKSEFGRKKIRVSNYLDTYNAETGFNCVTLSHGNASDLLASLYLDIVDKFMMDSSPYLLAFHMYIHPRGSYPFDHSSLSIDLRVGVRHFITLKIRGFHSIVVKNKPCSKNNVPQIVYLGNGHTRTFHYSSYLCKAAAVQTRMIEKCSCFSELFAAVITHNKSKDYHFCHSLNPSIVDIILQQNATLDNSSIDFNANPKNSLMIRRALCHQKLINELRDSDSFKTGNSECLSNCDAKQYAAKVNYIQINEQSKSNAEILPEMKATEALLKNQLNGTSLKYVWREGDLKDIVNIKSFYRVNIKVTPYSMKGSLVRQELNLSLSSVFGMMGSIIGMWMGMSLISLVEIAEFTLSIVHSHRMRQTETLSSSLPEKAAT